MARPKGIGFSDQIRALLRAGDSYNTIVAKLGVSKGTVAFHAKKIGRQRWTLGARKPKRRPDCAHCGGPRGKGRGVFCSNSCAHESRCASYIAMWKSGAASGSTKSGRIVSKVRRYIFESRGRKCEQCGWAEVNPATGKVPVTIDHIDGRWRNCREDNLRVLCPNCHSLTPTYGALNQGNGHPWRRRHYRNQVRARLDLGERDRLPDLTDTVS